MRCVLLSLRLNNSGTPYVIRLTNAGFNVEWDGYEYQSSGDLLSIGDYEATYDLTTQGVEVTLSGVDPSYLNVINNEGAFLRAPLDILIANVPDGTNVADSAVFYHRGFADTPNTDFDDESGSVSLGMETQSVFGDLDRTPELMGCNYANHSARHKSPSEDKFFQYASNVSFGEEQWIKG